VTGAPRAASLDPELAALAAKLGAPLVSARELTTLPSPVFDRPAWRIELADGRVLKGRVFGDVEEAARFAELAACLPARGFPMLRAHAGRAALLDWIEGSPMPALPPPALLRRCGELLGCLHRQKLPPDAEPRLSSGPSAVPEPLAPVLDEIAAAGAIEPRERDRLVALSERAFPARCERGLIHLDFCAENLLVSGQGEPWSVDNATLCIAPLDYDLARAALRWPLPPVARQAFLDGYRVWRDPAGFADHADYWRICAAAHSARLRLRRRAGDVATPVASLRRVLQRGAGR
jgi:Ser/Thr protein kinase RdoA (MazF antagonist)